METLFKLLVEDPERVLASRVPIPCALMSLARLALEDSTRNAGSAANDDVTLQRTPHLIRSGRAQG